MSKCLDLTGQRYGRLVVLERAANRVTPGGSVLARWICRCDCGNIMTVDATALRSGNTQSCGCLRSDMLRTLRTKHENLDRRLYHIWISMKGRCSNPNCKHYDRYGGRGIYVCDEWVNDYEAFAEWAMSHGYAENLTIDRIDNDGPYMPGNCRWADQTTQANNRSTTLHVEYNGEVHTFTEWAKITQIPYRTLKSRWQLGWSVEDMLTKPSDYQGKTSA